MFKPLKCATSAKQKSVYQRDHQRHSHRLSYIALEQFTIERHRDDTNEVMIVQEKKGQSVVCHMGTNLGSRFPRVKKKEKRIEPAGCRQLPLSKLTSEFYSTLLTYKNSSFFGLKARISPYGLPIQFQLPATLKVPMTSGTLFRNVWFILLCMPLATILFMYLGISPLMASHRIDHVKNIALDGPMDFMARMQIYVVSLPDRQSRRMGMKILLATLGLHFVYFDAMPLTILWSVRYWTGSKKFVHRRGFGILPTLQLSPMTLTPFFLGLNTLRISQILTKRSHF